MTQDNTSLLWQTKVAARLHDPAEKALVLLRDPAGHENGTSLALSRLLGLHALTADTIDPDDDQVLAHTIFPQGIRKSMYRHVQHADWWAAAADRPQWRRPARRRAGAQRSPAGAGGGRRVQNRRGDGSVAGGRLAGQPGVLIAGLAGSPGVAGGHILAICRCRRSVEALAASVVFDS